MKQIQIAENTWKIGSNLGNEELFEGIWPKKRRRVYQ